MEVVRGCALQREDKFRVSLDHVTVYTCTYPPIMGRSAIGEPWCVHDGNDAPVSVPQTATVFVLSPADIATHQGDGNKKIPPQPEPANGNPTG